MPALNAQMLILVTAFNNLPGRANTFLRGSGTCLVTITLAAACGAASLGNSAPNSDLSSDFRPQHQFPGLCVMRPI